MPRLDQRGKGITRPASSVRLSAIRSMHDYERRPTPPQLVPGQQQAHTPTSGITRLTCDTAVTGALWPVMVPILSSLSASQAMISQSNPADRRVPRMYDRACTPRLWSRKVARSFHEGICAGSIQ